MAHLRRGGMVHTNNIMLRMHTSLHFPTSTLLLKITSIILAGVQTHLAAEFWSFTLTADRLWRRSRCEYHAFHSCCREIMKLEILWNYAELSTIMFVHRMTLEWKQMTKKRCWKIWQIRYHIHTWYSSYIEYAACAKHKRSLSCKKMLLKRD